MENQLNERRNLEQQIIEKAMKDADFRQQLLENPRETLGKEFAVNIPESIKITVFEESPLQFYLVLPNNNQGLTEGVLTEEELKEVSGGNGKKLYSTEPQFCNIWNSGA